VRRRPAAVEEKRGARRGTHLRLRPGGRGGRHRPGRICTLRPPGTGGGAGHHDPQRGKHQRRARGEVTGAVPAQPHWTWHPLLGQRGRDEAIDRRGRTPGDQPHVQLDHQRGARAVGHPLPGLYAAGVPVCLNSDDPNLFGIDLVNEYSICQRHFGFGEKEFNAMNLAALRHSFLPKEITERVARLL